MSIGLCGGHRTGKTTLAKEYAKKFKIPFVETSVSAIFRELGLDPAVTYDFATRLMIQEEILKRIDAKLADYGGEEFITDRTPIDFIGYTLADAIGDRVPDDCQDRLRKYVNDCFDVTNRRFSSIFLIQPGIRLVREEGKAAMNEAYIEHLNSLILGLTVDERLKSYHFYIPRNVTELDERVMAIKTSVERIKIRSTVELADLAGMRGSMSMVLH